MTHAHHQRGTAHAADRAPDDSGLPPIIAAHLSFLRRDLDEVKAEQQAQDEKLDLVLDRVSELLGRVSHLAGRLDQRPATAVIAKPPQPSAAALAAAQRRPSWLTVAVVGAVCSAVVGPVLTVVARAIIGAQAP